jgi:hypothetical protein
VLGRFGVINILAEHLILLLQGDSELPRPLTLADIARLVANSMSADAQGPEKLLSRLNAGLFVQETKVHNLAQILGIEPDSLCFCHPSVYQEKAWARRERGTKAEEGRQRALERFLIEAERVTPLDPESILEFVKALDKNIAPSIQKKIAPLDSAAGAAVSIFLVGLDAARAEINPIERTKILIPLLASLESSGIGAWFGKYDDFEPIDPSDQDADEAYWGVISRRVPRLVIALSAKLGAPPSIMIDRSDSPTLDG